MLWFFNNNLNNHYMIIEQPAAKWLDSIFHFYLCFCLCSAQFRLCIFILTKNEPMKIDSWKKTHAANKTFNNMASLVLMWILFSGISIKIILISFLSIVSSRYFISIFHSKCFVVFMRVHFYIYLFSSGDRSICISFLTAFYFVISTYSVFVSLGCLSFFIHFLSQSNVCLNWSFTWNAPHLNKLIRIFFSTFQTITVTNNHTKTKLNHPLWKYSIRHLILPHINLKQIVINFVINLFKLITLCYLCNY